MARAHSPAAAFAVLVLVAAPGPESAAARPQGGSAAQGGALQSEASPIAAPQAGAGLNTDLARAQRLLGGGDAAGAEAILRPATVAHPDSGPAWFLLGFAVHSQGRLEEALTLHTRAAEFPAQAAAASYNAGCACALLGRTDEAFEWLERARGAGTLDRGNLLTDPDLQSLRSDPRFAALLPDLPRGADAWVEEVRVIHTIEGTSAGEEYGWVGRNMGDLDGDDVADFALTAPSRQNDGPQAGRLDVFSGHSGELLWRRDGTTGQRLGASVAPAGDVNGDGVSDVIVGAPGYPGSPATGQALVLSGADGSELLALTGTQKAEQFGLMVCGVGDVDRDGKGDLAVGSPGFAGAAGAGSGRVSLHSGASGDVLSALEGQQAGDAFGTALAASMNADALVAVGAPGAGMGRLGTVEVYAIEGAKLEHRFTMPASSTGRSMGQYFVSFPGDLDGDGVGDVYGSDFSDTRNGRVVVHSGASGKLLLELFGPVPGEGFGTSVSDAGDVNGDGAGDLIVGAWQNGEGGASAGKCYLYSGADGSLLATYTSASPGDTLGFDATGLGDVDGDGGVDFLLTSAWSAVVGLQSGRAFVVAGPVFEQPSPATEPSVDGTNPSPER
ncbi:TPR end-of-group domain-containing protein [Engelhardtia mirabilis]|uniref:FG-GAP repeat protein n=1 Tax=Engelhardtia mirabilis TaxID=2528011 RepID=A0A518BP36_9BACT|nr:FG-GAP repeat protein [Planctomycetes bacterium Pla133]QDV03043.1 FG-GAP repeat protein [Planctomycetes bacterium Pla86]